MSCEKCADNRLSMRVEALRLAVDGASISHKIDFEETADRYFVWLMQANKKSQKKDVKKELT
jgi:hypothetical protein